MNLYDMTAEYQAILRQIEEAEGEITDEQVAALFQFDTDFPRKVENCAKMVRCFQRDSEAQKAEADLLAEKAKRSAGRADRLKAYMLMCMKAVGRDRVNGVLNARIQKSAEHPATIDESVLPKTFWRKPEPPPEEPDRKAIMEARKAGQEVPGVTFGRTEFIVIW